MRIEIYLSYHNNKNKVATVWAEVRVYFALSLQQYVHVYIITLYTLSLNNVAFQLYINKEVEGEK